MKLPRFHLLTVLIACFVLSLFVGANLVLRWSIVVEFYCLNWIRDEEEVSKSTLYNCYKRREFTLGWPIQIAASPKTYLHIDNFDWSPINAVERRELERLLASDHNDDSRWDGRIVESLAPTIYAGMIDLDGEKPPSYVPQDWEFVPIDAVDMLFTNKLAVAMNAAAALAAAFAVAAACELILRRKQKRYPQDSVRTSSFVIRTSS